MNCLQKDMQKTFLGYRYYSHQAPSTTAKLGYTRGDCHIPLPYIEGIYTYVVEISPGRVVKTVGPIGYGKIAVL